MIDEVTWLIQSTYCEECIAPLFECDRQNPDFYKIDILKKVLFYRTFSCESPPNPLKRWADRIVLRSRDITGDYWLETNWWPW